MFRVGRDLCGEALKKRLFTERVASPWNRLPKEVVRAPGLSELMEHLDDALSQMV